MTSNDYNHKRDKATPLITQKRLLGHLSILAVEQHQHIYQNIKVAAINLLTFT